MKKILSLALAASMCASLMLTTTAVNAETTATDLVPLYDFNDLETGEISAAQLNDLGILTGSIDGNATMTIEDMSSDATYGSLGKVLKYEPTSADTGTAAKSSIEFPINDYSLKSGEKLVVEYVFHFDAVYAGTSEQDPGREDCFGSESGNFGSVGQMPIFLFGGGNGWQLNFYGRNTGYRIIAPLFDARNGGSVVNAGWYLIKQEIDYDEYLKDNTAGIKYSVTDVATGKAIAQISGETFNGVTAEYGKGHVNGTDISNLKFEKTNGRGQVWIDNVRVYTMPAFKLESSTIENNATDVFYDTKTITATFSNDVADASGVTVSGLSADAYTVTKDGKNITVSFNENLAFETTYTVNFTGITDTLGQTMGDCQISFTTETAPDILLKDIKYTSGIGSSFSSALGAIDAESGLGGVTLKLENTKDSDRNVNVIFAVYGSEGGVFEKAKSVESTVPANGMADISMGVDTTGMSGKFVKAFVWDSFDSLKPWVGSIELKVQ